MLVVDDLILATLRGNEFIAGDSTDDDHNVYDGQMVPPRAPGAPPQKVVFAVPYLVYRSNIGLDQQRRLAGRRTRRSVFFELVYVGGSRDQAKWIGEVARFQLERTRLDLPEPYNSRSGLIEVEDGGSQRIWRDDDAVQPDGKPLYYGVDQYAVPIQNPRASALVGP